MSLYLLHWAGLLALGASGRDAPATELPPAEGAPLPAEPRPSSTEALPPSDDPEALRWSGLVLPLFGANTTDGFGFGAGGEIFARPRSQEEGYKVKLQVLGWVTTNLSYTSDYAQIEVRGERAHWIGRAGYRGWSNLAYAGSGGADIRQIRDNEQAGNQLRSPFGFMGVAVPVARDLKLYGQLYSRYLRVAPGPGSLLDQDRPWGIDGGLYLDGTIGLALDTTDHWPLPSKGWRAEVGPRIGFTAAPDGQVEPLVGLFAEAIRWQPIIGEHLVFGARATVDGTLGKRPFFEQENAGGRWRDELGSDQLFAGYGRTRTRGDALAALAVELRPMIAQINHSFFDFNFYLSGFAEIGWLAGHGELGPPMPTLGLGPELSWKDAIQMRPAMAWGWREEAGTNRLRPVPQFVVSFMDPL